MISHHEFIDVSSLVESVSKKVLDWRSNDDFRTVSDPNGFKTKADLEANALLTQGLMQLHPDIPILSEESAHHSIQRPPLYWLLDPIDGTSSWHGGFDGFVTQAALIKDNIPIFGVISAPALKRLWTALQGKGAFLNHKLLPSLTSHSRLCLVDNYPEPRGIASELVEYLPTTNYLECGSIGLKSALVADGTADLFVKDIVVRDWDIAPAYVLLKEVGACLSLPSGEPFVFSGSYEKNEGVIIARDNATLNNTLTFFSRSHN